MNQRNLWNNTKEMSKTNGRSNSNGEKKKNLRRPLPRPHETEEEAILRRFHDAQRMARFRAKKKKAIEEAKALEAAKLTEMTIISELKRRNVQFQIKNSNNNNYKNNCNNNANNHHNGNTNCNFNYNNKNSTSIINNHKNNNNNSNNNNNNNSNDSIIDQRVKIEKSPVKVKSENSVIIIPTVLSPSKYSQLLTVIEELGRDIRLTYAGSKSSAERLKMGIIQARMLVRECLIETKLNSRQ